MSIGPDSYHNLELLYNLARENPTLARNSKGVWEPLDKVY